MVKSDLFSLPQSMTRKQGFHNSLCMHVICSHLLTNIETRQSGKEYTSDFHMQAQVLSLRSLPPELVLEGEICALLHFTPLGEAACCGEVLLVSWVFCSVKCPSQNFSCCSPCSPHAMHAGVAAVRIKNIHIGGPIKF